MAAALVRDGVGCAVAECEEPVGLFLLVAGAGERRGGEFGQQAGQQARELGVSGGEPPRGRCGDRVAEFGQRPGRGSGGDVVAVHHVAQQRERGGDASGCGFGVVACGDRAQDGAQRCPDAGGQGTAALLDLAEQAHGDRCAAGEFVLGQAPGLAGQGDRLAGVSAGRGGG